jgi:hypothetical protein
VVKKVVKPVKLVQTPVQKVATPVVQTVQKVVTPPPKPAQMINGDLLMHKYVYMERIFLSFIQLTLIINSKVKPLVSLA